jgi:hypothetical protein
VLVVWEPILPSDWRPPGRGALARISDSRARQFWDPQHLIAQAVARAESQSGRTRPACCFDNGFLWDEALLYPPGASWTGAPPAVFWDGPVWKVIPALETSLRSLPNPPAPR